MTALRLGTRGSDLALAQAGAVAQALRASDAAREVEIVRIVTAGDRGVAGDKARWIDTIERALTGAEIDLAIHSAKDVPAASELAPGMLLGAVLGREDARDALVGADSLDKLPHGSRIGTASLRRRAQLLAARPDLEIVELRGNVPTRLRKLDDGHADAIVLAAAGLLRLGLEDRIGCLLPLDEFVPSPGQGLLAVEGRELPQAIISATGETALSAERSVVEALGATCDTPVGCHDDGETLRVFAGMPDGSEWIRDRVGADTSAARAELAIERLESLGARDLLERAAALAP